MCYVLHIIVGITGLGKLYVKGKESKYFSLVGHTAHVVTTHFCPGTQSRHKQYVSK